MRKNESRRAGGRLVAGGLHATLLATVLSGCDISRSLSVEDPGVVETSGISTVSALPAVRAAVLGDFQVAYSGSSGAEGQIQASAWLADEQLNAESFPTRIEVDMRTTNPVNATMVALFRDIQRARATAEVGSRRFGTLAPTNPTWAEVLSLAGFSYTILGENYCSGVPTSEVNDAGDLVFGASETTAQVFARALAKFDSAITVATAAGTGGTAFLNLARVGRARVLVNLNRVDEAAVTAAQVPNNFRYQILHSENTGRQNNGIFSFAELGRRFTIANREGGNGLPFVEDSLDGRLAIRRSASPGFDAVTPLFVTAKYPNRAAPATVADGAEARLIQAEAFMRAGDDVNFLAQLNLARANAQTFGSRPAPAPLTVADLGLTMQSRENLLFRERAYTMFLTSHRVGDLRRLIRQYGRNPETVFPTGAYFKGGSYGTDVNLPIPFEENNNQNPAFGKSCINRSA